MADTTLDQMFLNRFEMQNIYEPDEVVFGAEGYTPVPPVEEEPETQAAESNTLADMLGVLKSLMFEKFGGEDSDPLRGLATGVSRASTNMFEGIPFPEGLTLEDGTPVDNFAMLGEWMNQSTGTDFQVEPPETTAGMIVEGVTQATVGILPTSRILKAMGLGHRLARDIIAGFTGDFITSSDEEAKGYVQLIDTIPDVYGWDVAGEISNVTSEWMTDPDGEVDELKARLVASIPGVVLSPVLDGFMALASVAKGAGASAGGKFTADVKMRFDKALEAKGVSSYRELRDKVDRGE